MAKRARSYFFRAASAVALALLIAGCTKGGQFDPTEIFSSDVFDSKKKLKGERTPVFPEGVPGASSGVPADLVKGYQPPPEPADADAAVPGPTPPAAAAEATKPKPKPKLTPKPKLAAQKPPASPGTTAPAAGPTRIIVGPKPATQQPDASQTAWPAPPSTNPPQSQTSQSVWPAPPQTASSPSAQPSQSIWPDPPSAGSSR
jgi:outer membrane biosynthesis protein TonB